MFSRDRKPPIGRANIKIAGVGGGGSNAVSRMFRQRLTGIEYISINTDSQALNKAHTPIRLRVGDTTARGLGVGGNPTQGRVCHEENREEIKDILQGADLVFVAAGMGGGTGTGGAPVVAQVAKELGALTVAVVTKPFDFEGKKRQTTATKGIEELSGTVDTLIVIPNQRLISIADNAMSMKDAFIMADDVLRQGVQAISELILVPGEINLDFADLRTVMNDAGHAWMAIGKGTGVNRAVEAAQQAIESPLLELSIDGAKGVIFNVTGGEDLTLDEVYDAAGFITDMAAKNARIFFGNTIDPKLEGEVRMTVIATGFPSATDKEAEQETTYSNDEIKVLMQDEENVKLPPFMRHLRRRSFGLRLRKKRRNAEPDTMSLTESKTKQETPEVPAT